MMHKVLVYFNMSNNTYDYDDYAGPITFSNNLFLFLEDFGLIHI